MLVKSHFNNMKSLQTKNGFTLVEMTVSLGLFTIIMFIATSAFLSIVNTDRKARSVRIAADNLNIALEDMSRRIKTGHDYACDDRASGTYDCPGGVPSNMLSFDDQTSTPSVPVRIVYKRATGPTCGIGYDSTQGCILRDDKLITSPEIDITGLKFIVSGSDVGSADNQQPMVVIVIDGSLGSGATESGFKIQTTVTQRAYDNQ